MESRETKAAKGRRGKECKPTILSMYNYHNLGLFRVENISILYRFIFIQLPLYE